MGGVLRGSDIREEGPATDLPYQRVRFSQLSTLDSQLPYSPYNPAMRSSISFSHSSQATPFASWHFWERAAMAARPWRHALRSRISAGALAGWLRKDSASQ